MAPYVVTESPLDLVPVEPQLLIDFAPRSDPLVFNNDAANVTQIAKRAHLQIRQSTDTTNSTSTNLLSPSSTEKVTLGVIGAVSLLAPI